MKNSIHELAESSFILAAALLAEQYFSFHFNSIGLELFWTTYLAFAAIERLNPDRNPLRSMSLRKL